MPRYTVTLTVELDVEATDHNYAQAKAMRWLSTMNEPQQPAGISQMTLWQVDVLDTDTTAPEREDEDKYEHRQSS